MKKIFTVLTLCCALVACRKTQIEFSYSPETPRAGQTVSFSNWSSSGEEWEWNFGDGSTSTLKNPSHVYKNPGKYLVSLKVDKKAAMMISKNLEVYDTVPSFVASDSLFYIYQDYTFTASLYNPYNYDVIYSWDIPGADSIADATESSITCFFTKPEEAAQVSLTIIMNEDTTLITRSYLIQDKKTNAVLMRTEKGDYHQRIFGERAEQVLKATDTIAEQLLDKEQDTLQIYNGNEFKLSELVTIFPSLQGFHIANRKIYYRADGLWVAHINGSDAVQIDAEECLAMTLDIYANRIYWANKYGVWFMPFVGSDNNQFVTIPTLLNNIENVQKIAIDYTLR